MVGLQVDEGVNSKGCFRIGVTAVEGGSEGRGCSAALLHLGPGSRVEGCGIMGGVVELEVSSDQLFNCMSIIAPNEVF